MGARMDIVREVVLHPLGGRVGLTVHRRRRRLNPSTARRVSVEHVADYTQWTLHITEGIKFHDGTPLDGAAVSLSIDSCGPSPLAATALLSIDAGRASGRTS